jgi:alpha-beta hydrolase superfamily lysophospholipase
MNRFLRWAIIALLALPFLAWASGALLHYSEQSASAEVSPEFQMNAREYLDANLVALPESWRFERFQREDGVELEAAFAPVENAIGTIIISPGYTAPLELMGAVVQDFQTEGYNIAALSTRGQGRSHRALENDEKAWMKTYQTPANDLAAFSKLVAERMPGPQFIFGISQGAHIALRMGMSENTEVKAMSLSVPMVKIATDPWPYAVAMGIGQFFSGTGLGEMYAPGRGNWKPTQTKWGEPTECNSNPDTAWRRDALFALDPELRSHAPSTQWLAATARSTKFLMDGQNTANLRVPVLMSLAGNDTIVQTADAETLCGMLSSCKVKIYDASRHCIEAENADVRRSIIQDSVALFKEAAR